MLINIVGKTGSGKSLYQAYKVYDELTRIMNNGKDIPFYLQMLGLVRYQYSYYDVVALNSNFDDGRGNFTRFVKSGNKCNCKKQYRNVKITYDGNTKLLLEDLVKSIGNIDPKDPKNDEVLQKGWIRFHDILNKTSGIVEKVWEQTNYGEQFALVDHWEDGGFCKGVSDLPDVYDLRNCYLSLDEGGTQFSNRDWADMPDGYLLFLTTHRHNVTHIPKRFDIVLYTQQSDLVDITLRRLANHIYLIRPLFGYASDPTRPSWFKTRPALRMWTYWKHELLQANSPALLDSEGRPLPLRKDQMVERLDFYSWFWFPSFFKRKNKYVACYNTLDEVRELKRLKGK